MSDTAPEIPRTSGEATLEPAPSRQLSAILVVSERRRRAQRALDALAAQTAIAVMEIIVIDLMPMAVPRLVAPANATVTYVSEPKSTIVTEGRCEALRYVSSPVVAYLEEHTIPAPEWAAALIERHKGPWAAVTYAFENANPSTYTSRACLVNDYGTWLAPAPHGPATHAPGHNIAYKRDLLVQFGDRLNRLLTPDFNLHQELRAAGHMMFVESHAVIAHENFERFGGPVRAHYVYMRLLAARRAELGGWSLGRRLFYGVAGLVAAPTIGMWRLYGGLRGRMTLLPLFLSALPVVAMMRVLTAVGESVGYVIGEGNTERELHYWETIAERSGP